MKIVVAAIVGIALLLTGFAAAQALSSPGPVSVPLCPGLTIVTAINQKDGDYESIKTIESIGPTSVQLKYSSERMSQDIFATGAPKLQSYTVHRSIRLEDLKTATLYLQQFYDKIPSLVPRTTAIGASAAVLEALKTKGESDFGIFNPFTGDNIVLEGSHPNVYDYQMISKIHRVGTSPVMMPVIVNNKLLQLPAIQAAGEFYGDKAEFFFLDDPQNPIALKYRVGIGGIRQSDVDNAKMTGQTLKAGGDKDVLQVIKITYDCSPLQSPSPGAAQVPASQKILEQELTQTGRAEVYDIYFSFNSDKIREESQGRIKEIAGVLRAHPDWKLSVEGHTDNIAGDAFNLDLFKRRAAAVKEALVKNYQIDPARLSTVGYGKTRPKDTNATLEGRAHNRRVELVRQEQAK